jgi:hypothetical protein
MTTLTNYEGSASRTLSLARVLAELGRVVREHGDPGAVPTRMHDYKGCLTIWWKNIGGLRFRAAVDQAWRREGECEVEHRVGREGRLVHPRPCPWLPDPWSPDPWSPDDRRRRVRGVLQ